jgi:hypothetical protein
MERPYASTWASIELSRTASLHQRAATTNREFWVAAVDGIWKLGRRAALAVVETLGPTAPIQAMTRPEQSQSPAARTVANTQHTRLRRSSEMTRSACRVSLADDSDRSKSHQRLYGDTTRTIDVYPR